MGGLLWGSATWAHLFHGILLSCRGGCKAGDARGPPGIWAEGIVPAAPRALLLEGLLPSLLGEEAPTARP